MITGAAGFIGTNFLIYWMKHTNEPIICIDKKIPKQQHIPLATNKFQKNIIYEQANIHNKKKISALLANYKPRAIIHLAAETHVDKSILFPDLFIQNNVVDTFQFIQYVLKYWKTLEVSKKQNFRFIYISTDEVFGTLAPYVQPIVETNYYHPNNPYSATKAAADHLLQAWHHTFQFPSIIAHSTNNYGPFQAVDKFIPKVIFHAYHEISIPLYGNGLQSRDWLHVNDHCCAIHLILEHGLPGESYNIGANHESTNINTAKLICMYMDKKKPRKIGQSYETLIQFVTDRLGHDQRYALNSNKLQQTLKWTPKFSFKMGLQRTVDWYLSNINWIQ